MSSAATAVLVGFIGLLGVIAGSLLSGWVQTRQAEKDRKLRARVAARVVYADIELAWQQLDYQLEHTLSVPQDPDIRRYLANWAEHRDAFAAGVAFREYHTVAAGFASLDSYPVLPRHEARRRRSTHPACHDRGSRTSASSRLGCRWRIGHGFRPEPCSRRSSRRRRRRQLAAPRPHAHRARFPRARRCDPQVGSDRIVGDELEGFTTKPVSHVHPSGDLCADRPQVEKRWIAGPRCDPGSRSPLESRPQGDRGRRASTPCGSRSPPPIGAPRHV